MEKECISNSLIITTIKGKGSLKESRVQLPQPRSNEAIVHNSHIAQNTIDVENLDGGNLSEGTVLGCDFVGYVESIGSHVSKLKEGDLIAGLITGGEHCSHGAYSEYTIADEDLCFKVPPNLGLEEAATVPLGSCLAKMGLFSKSCLDLGPKIGPDATLLVWGGSACVGRFAIQIASLFRIRVIATSGPWNFDMLKSLGAKHVLDYRDENLLDRITELAPDLGHIFDTIGTSSITAATLSKKLLKGRGRLCALRLNENYASGISSQTRVSDVAVWRAFLHNHDPHANGDSRTPSVSDHELATRLFHSLPKWLNDGFVKPNHPRVLKGGLQAVTDGFEKDRSEGPLDYKIVYQI